MSRGFPDKATVVGRFLGQLDREIETTTKALAEARDSLHSGDERARNRGERGVIQEKAWLLSAQMERLDSLQARRQALAGLAPARPDWPEQPDRTGSGSLVALEPLDLAEDRPRLFFIFPGLGGTSVAVEGWTVVAVSPEAPLGQALLGRQVDDEVRVKIDGRDATAVIIDLA